MAFIEHREEIQILLVGRDGNGKTSCKRSIENVSNKIEVVECLGVGDTGSDRMEDIKIVWNNLRMILENCDKRGGFKAIVFVMKYGVRFTKQEKEAVEDVKAMFGEDVFRKHGIILMSYGDLFEMFISEDEGDFVGWCREQTGDIQKLFEEVDHRIVLFNNKTNNIDEKKAQVEEFKSLVAGVGNSYGLKEFKMAPNSIKFNKTNNIDENKEQVEEFHSLEASDGNSYGLNKFTMSPHSIKFNPTSKSEKAFRLLPWCAILILFFIMLFVLSIYTGPTWLMYLSIGVIMLIIIVTFISWKANAASTFSRDSSFNNTRLPMNN